MRTHRIAKSDKKLKYSVSCDCGSGFTNDDKDLLALEFQSHTYIAHGFATAMNVSTSSAKKAKK
jgi:hypothetical protein